MKLVRSILSEVWGLFVDDASLAILSLALIALVAALVKLTHVPPVWGGAVLALGCLVVLAISVDRGARKR
jgi:hypothetical protein